MVNRTSGHTISTLSAGEDIVSNPFKPFRGDRDPVSECFLREDGEELEQEPLDGGEFKVKKVLMEKDLLKRAEPS